MVYICRCWCCLLIRMPDNDLFPVADAYYPFHSKTITSTTNPEGIAWSIPLSAVWEHVCYQSANSCVYVQPTNKIKQKIYIQYKWYATVFSNNQFVDLSGSRFHLPMSSPSPFSKEQWGQSFRPVLKMFSAWRPLGPGVLTCALGGCWFHRTSGHHELPNPTGVTSVVHKLIQKPSIQDHHNGVSKACAMQWADWFSNVRSKPPPVEP